LDGLRGLADPDGRGIITAAQLAAWIEPRVVRDSKGKMTPQYSKLDGEGQFVFVRPGARLVAAPPRPAPRELEIREEARRQLGSLALNSRVDGVEIWLGDQRLGEARSGRTLVVNNVVEGMHMVRATKAGHKEWRRDIEVAANRR